MPAPSFQQAVPLSPKPANAGVRSRKSSISEDDRPLAARSRLSQPAPSSQTSSNRTPSNLTPSSRAYPNLIPATQKPLSQPASRQSSTNPTSSTQKPTSPLPPTGGERERLPSSSAKNSPVPPFLPERPDRNTPLRRSSNSSSAEERKREGAVSRAITKANEVESGGQRVLAKNGRPVSSVRVNETGPGVARPPAKNVREFQLGRVSQPTANGPGAAAANGRKRRRDGE